MNQNCTKCKADFTLDQDDLSFYEKMKVPAPKVCPDCRFKMRAVFRNERTLYKRNCGLCGRSIIAMYNPKSSYIVYCNDCFISDNWDPFSFAMDYDAERPFFSQLKELTLRVPKCATYSTSNTGPNVNSEYANFAGGNKDGYLIFNSGPGNENCAYSRGIIDSRDVFDVYYGDELENSYECVGAHKSNGVVWCTNVSDCVDSTFLLSCAGCTNCFGCVNLRHKSYHFLNEPMEREEWQKKVSEIFESYEKMEEFKKQFEEFSLKFPRRANTNLKVSNCSGDYIFESKNCQNSMELSFCEDMRHCFSVKRGKDCADQIGNCRSSELLYNGVGVGANSRMVICSWWIEICQDVMYSFCTLKSSDCIGCDGVKGGKYVILNKRYPKDEYEKIKEKILQELKEKQIFGDFFPSELSPFAYNETIGQDNMPLSKEEAIREGHRWEDDIQKTEGQETINPEEIPDKISDVDEQIINEVLRCINCSRNYKIFNREFQFLQKRKIPLPRQCWNCRFRDRITRRGPYKFWNRNCAKCEKGIVTNYAPERPEIVYCESCFQQEVY